MVSNDLVDNFIPKNNMMDAISAESFLKNDYLRGVSGMASKAEAGGKMSIF